MSRQLRAIGETIALDAAVTHAKLLMSTEDHKQVSAVTKDAEVEMLLEQVALLTEQVAILSTASRIVSSQQ